MYLHIIYLIYIYIYITGRWTEETLLSSRRQLEEEDDEDDDDDEVRFHFRITDDSAGNQLFLQEDTEGGLGTKS